MANPLHVNCTAFKVDNNGKVIGVRLGITPVDNGKYELYSVRLKDEYEAAGATVAQCSVLDKQGINTGIQCRLSWPGPGPTFANSLLPGNPNNQHIIVNGYDAYVKMGPLAIHVGSKDGPSSDVVFGLGLPFNRHVSYDIVFKERGSVILPTTDVEQRLTDLETWAKAMGKFRLGDPQFFSTQLKMMEEESTFESVESLSDDELLHRYIVATRGIEI